MLRQQCQSRQDTHIKCVPGKLLELRGGKRQPLHRTKFKSRNAQDMKFASCPFLFIAQASLSLSSKTGPPSKLFVNRLSEKKYHGSKLPSTQYHQDHPDKVRTPFRCQGIRGNASRDECSNLSCAGTTSCDGHSRTKESFCRYHG